MSPARRWLLAALAGLAFAAAIVVVIQPGHHDLLPSRWTGMQAVDDGYWTSPTRRLAGAGRSDEYDERLANALALPQNAIASAAVGLGVPFDTARFVPSLLAAALLVALAVGTRRWLLLAAVFAPPVLGHLSSDLGEGTACAIVAGWALAISSGRLALAGALAAVGLSQKACGLFLGVGTLVAVLEARPRLASLRRAAVGGVAALVATTAIASIVFGDDPVGFLTRPFTATRDTGAGIAWEGVVPQALFAAYHGPAKWALGLFLAALAGLGVRNARPAVAAALVAGIVWVGVFPEPWRIVPLLPLFGLVLGDAPPVDPSSTPRSVREWSFVAAMLAICQLAGATVGAVHDVVDSPRAGMTFLVLATVPFSAALVATRLLARKHGPRIQTACAIVVALGIVGSLAASVAMLSWPRERRCLDVSDEVAARIPADASLIGPPCLATRLRGTLYYPQFESLWEGELERARPATLYRIRTDRGPGSVPSAPAGYRVVATEPLRATLRSPTGAIRPLTLDRLER